MRRRTLEVLRNLLIPQSDITLVVVDNGAELCVAAQVVHELVHTLDAVNEVDDNLLGALLIERNRNIVDRLAEDGWETRLHCGMREAVLMVATVRSVRIVSSVFGMGVGRAHGQGGLLGSI